MMQELNDQQWVEHQAMMLTGSVRAFADQQQWAQLEKLIAIALQEAVDRGRQSKGPAG